MASNNPDQNTLTAPADRDSKHVFDFNKAPLTDSQVESATKDLVDKAHLELYPAQERAFADPTLEDQDYCLVSFVPSVSATPDKDGIYGMVKVRGTYNSLEKCDKRAEFLIKEVDSLHKIYIAGVGKPFPITNMSTFSKDINKVKIQDTLAEELNSQQTKEEKELAEMKQRERELLDRNKKSNEELQREVPIIDKYITTRVKKAQLTFTYIETMKKIEQMRKSILESRQEIADMDESDPELSTSYLERYNDALEKVSLDQQKDSFVKYLENDATEELGF